MYAVGNHGRSAEIVRGGKLLRRQPDKFEVLAVAVTLRLFQANSIADSAGLLTEAVVQS